MTRKNKWVGAVFFLAVVLSFFCGMVAAEEVSSDWTYETEATVRGVSVSTYGTAVAAGGDDGKVTLLGYDGEVLWEGKAQANVNGVSVAPNGSAVGATSSDNHVYLYDVSGERRWSYLLPGRGFAVAVADGGAYVAAGGSDDRVYLFDGEGNVLWRHVTGGDVLSTAISPDGSLVAAGTADNRVRLLDSSGKLLWSNVAFGNVLGVSCSPDGKYVVAGTSEGWVYLFSVDNGESLWEFHTGGSVTSVSTAEGARRVAVGSLDRTISVLDQSGERTLTRDTGAGVRSVALTPDGLTLVIGSDDHMVRAYTLPPKEPEVTPTAVTPTGVVTEEPVATNGALAITSNPPGAAVYMDNLLVGKTPVTVPDLEPGNYTVSLELEGYEPWSGAVQVQAGTTVTVNGTLAQCPETTQTRAGTSLPTMAILGIVFGVVFIGLKKND